MRPLRSTAELPFMTASAARGRRPTGVLAMAWRSTAAAPNPRQPAPSPTTTAVESYQVRGATTSSMPGHGRAAFGMSPSRNVTPPATSPR
jgi:hypothetical protein